LEEVPFAGILVESHAAEEISDVREEVVIAEKLIGVHVVEEASGGAIALPKNLISLLPYRIPRSEVLEAYCPIQRCTPIDGMGRLHRHKALEPTDRWIDNSDSGVFYWR
jgi:hypothetical protein